MSDTQVQSNETLLSEEKHAIDVSIIVVSYNTREMTLECLRSVIRETQRESYELIVVDNQSTDGSAAAIAEEFPEIRLLRPDQNLGFAKANNVAAEYAQGEFLLLLNPDTVVLDGAIDCIVEFARAYPQAGIWGGRTLRGDRTLDPTSCWGKMTLWSVFCRAIGLNVLFPGSEVFNRQCYGNWQRDCVREVDIVTGCFLLIRQETWSTLHGFDSTFFMYGEEADLCLRAKQLGVRAAISPVPTIIHFGGASESVPVDQKTKLLRGEVTLISRHWNRPARRVGVWLLMVSQLVRYWGHWLAARVSRDDHRVEAARISEEIWKQRHHWLKGYS